MKKYSEPLGCIAYFVGVIAIICCLLLCGCKQTEFIRVVEHHTDSMYITQHTRDSIYLHDSIHVREKGDTVLIERWHTAWRDRLRVDTMMVQRVDSIPVPYEVIKEKEVEKPLTWWQKTRLILANILLGGGAIALVIWHGKKKLKL